MNFAFFLLLVQGKGEVRVRVCGAVKIIKGRKGEGRRAKEGKRERG